MPKLSDLECRKAKPADTPIKLVDGGGLYLLINTTGSKLWRYNYRHAGKQKTLALGAYPDIPLAIARERHQEARSLLARGIDPSGEKKATKQAEKASNANTVQAVAERWMELHAAKVTPGTLDATKRILANNLFPFVGSTPITNVSKAELLAVIQKLEARGVGYSAHKLLTHCRQIWALAMDEEIIDRDPTVTLRKQLKAYKVTHHPAITDPVKLGELLRAMDGYTGNIVTTSALRLAPMLFVRTGELRHARWLDIDLDRAEWAYISTKTHTPHIVPLPTQAVTILTTLHEVTGGGELVFPGTRSKTKPISDNTINAALRYLGFSGDDVVGHGFRATARTILDEVLQYPPHIIEQQLAHAVKDPNGRAYNRTAHLPQRTVMMQAWADYLDKLKTGADVLPFKRTA